MRQWRMRCVDIIGAASGWGAPDQRCGEGPDVLAQAGIVERIAQCTDDKPLLEILRPPLECGGGDPLAMVYGLCKGLVPAVKTAVMNKHFPIVVGGDHSCAVGTWSGVYGAMSSQGRIGLIWVDAHMDSHVPQTSPSGALHGMPLACLLGYGEQVLTQLDGPAPKLLPRHVCLVGVRSYEAGEAALLARLGVRVFYAEEVRTRGLAAVWREALHIVTRGTVGYGISIDLDAIDPRDAPGTGLPVPGGIEATALVEVLRGVRCDPSLLALEIAEYNPYYDQEDKTMRLVADLICAVVVQRACNERHH